MAPTLAFLSAFALLAVVPLAAGQASLSASLRNSSTLPLAPTSVVVNPWTNHYRYAPIVVPVNTTLTFIWDNDDHGVWLLNNDQCPESFTDNANGQQELYPVTKKASGMSNYTTQLTTEGIYYFTCQQGVHCLQGQRMEVTVYDYTQGLIGSVAQYAPSPTTSTAPEEAHSVATSSAGRKLM